MASAEIVTIGTEILLGHLVDTNSVHIARVLADHGVDVYAKHSVGDNTGRLAAMLDGVLARADGAVCTGGLGPTVDDLTKDAVAHAVGKKLVLHEPSLRAMEERFRQFNRPMADNNRRQAYLPEGCVVLDNPHGTAPGFVALRDDGKFVACMPGVPREMKPMLAETAGAVARAALRVEGSNLYAHAAHGGYRRVRAGPPGRRPLSRTGEPEDRDARARLQRRREDHGEGRAAARRPAR